MLAAAATGGNGPSAPSDTDRPETRIPIAYTERNNIRLSFVEVDREPHHRFVHGESVLERPAPSIDKGTGDAADDPGRTQVPRT